ncbi:hypothetical protein TRSC58_07355 [Trypanosoma rangeli SC58]|uniref:Uncharacterized protein n=1 Tax=Trypanosoma rangeli SC58 TaxID=429131 RepID=A0A061IS25_TRYRA|nr:hypothetical protein TRSC58_07355 [Trypanosoma rangeli SC58]
MGWGGWGGNTRHVGTASKGVARASKKKKRLRRRSTQGSCIYTRRHLFHCTASAAVQGTGLDAGAGVAVHAWLYQGVALLRGKVNLAVIAAGE